ncbi:MAG: putative hydroxymethylpyrimidine transport system substrate-binding protein [Solirubrobacterales bacterium]|jgi:NitT/TauT family transport system substrate-binding protein/putative hydroxymethylpyrimidine transport system substrate-binding protein|nr:putative hydroxymethylpyrimidine transport system substrate-binding protein [Solirubrobacterales bacterium]
MRRVAALLAAALLGAGLFGCGGGGAEPGAPQGATLVLDFQPNAVHAGIYAAQANGYFKDAGVDLTIQEPSSTADSAKLLEAGRADFAVMDISDFGIARERGLDLVAIAAIVQRPLAAVIARDRNAIRTPADLAGKTIGVTGVPSDDAVLDTVLRSGGADPSSVHPVTIGFNAVADLAAGKVDAATAFWNAEGVQLQRQGIPIREFRVDQFGAPRYPELLLVAKAGNEQLGAQVSAALGRGYRVLGQQPQKALDDLLAQVPGLDRSAQLAELQSLTSSHAFSLGGVTATPDLRRGSIESWRAWALRSGLLGGG